MGGSFPAKPSPCLSPTGSLRQWQVDPGRAHHLRGCSAREPSTGWDSWAKSEAQRWSHGGVARKPHPCRGARADRKGRKLACPTGELTPQRSPGVPRKQRRYAPLPPGGPKDRAGEGRQLRVRTGRQCLRAASPPRRHSGSPAPEVKGLPGGALPWGRGSGGKGTAGASGASVPDGRMGRMVCGGCTYSHRRYRRLRCCRRRLETPHPSACSRETHSLGGA